MWVKRFLDGRTIAEDRDVGATWLSTPREGLAEVAILDWKSGEAVCRLSGYLEYDHFRTAVSTAGQGFAEVSETIRGRLADGSWDVYEWNGRTCLFHTTKD